MVVSSSDQHCPMVLVVENEASGTGVQWRGRKGRTSRGRMSGLLQAKARAKRMFG